MADETVKLAQFASDLSYEQIPDRVRQRTVDILIDQLAYGPIWIILTTHHVYPRNQDR